jgi:hypothetical protein
MNHPDSTEHRVRRAEELIAWTGRERLRFLWYRLRLTISAGPHPGWAQGPLYRPLAGVSAR